MKYFEAKTGAKALEESVIPKSNLNEIKKHANEFAEFNVRKK